MASLSLRHIDKIYPGNVKAVSDFNLEIDDKEFIVIVGPSGCGKSTALRMIAGLEDISAGELWIGDLLCNDIEPKDRDIAMVFQNYALYPHMTVYDNMAFSLKIRKIAPEEIDRKVQEAAEILGIKQLLDRKPKALSGGQRQRVALGRAIVRSPKVFLLDEPLSNLDAKLRVQMRTEITKLHHRLQTTFIYVTHDQTEAMTMGTRIVVIKDGIIQQVDTPQSLYDNPTNQFVASFIGTPQMNFIKAKLSQKGKKLYAEFGDSVVEIPESKAKKLVSEHYIGKEVVFGVRPEDVHDEEIFISTSDSTVVNGVVEVIEKLGSETILYINIKGKEGSLIARVDARSKAVVGESIKLALDTKHCHMFDPQTEQTLLSVPKYNLIHADLVTENGVGKAKFGGHTLTVSNEVIRRVTEQKHLNAKVFMGISPDAITVGKNQPNVIQGTIDFVDKYPRFTAAYVKVEGERDFLIVKLPANATQNTGDKLDIQFSDKDVMLFDLNGNRIVAEDQITANEVAAVVKAVGENLVVEFGKTALTYTPNDINVTPGNYTIRINPKKIITQKEYVAHCKHLVKGEVIKVDHIGHETIAYVKHENFEPHFTARVPHNKDIKGGDKIKLAIAPGAITFEKTE